MDSRKEEKKEHGQWIQGRKRGNTQRMNAWRNNMTTHIARYRANDIHITL